MNSQGEAMKKNIVVELKQLLEDAKGTWVDKLPRVLYMDISIFTAWFNGENTL